MRQQELFLLSYFRVLASQKEAWPSLRTPWGRQAQLLGGDQGEASPGTARTCSRAGSLFLPSSNSSPGISSLH